MLLVLQNAHTLYALNVSNSSDHLQWFDRSTTIALTDNVLHFGALEIGAHVHIMTVKSSAQYACERVSLGGCIKL